MGTPQLSPVSAVFTRWFPVRLYEFTDGYMITAAHRSCSDLAGARVIKIGGRPVAEAAHAARALIGGDNDLYLKENLHPLSNAALLTGLGFARNERLQLKISKGGTTRDVVLDAMNGEPDFYWRFRSEVFGTGIGGFDDWIAAY